MLTNFVKLFQLLIHYNLFSVIKPNVIKRTGEGHLYTKELDVTKTD